MCCWPLTLATEHVLMQHLEKIGDHAKAVDHYEASGCGPVEVTRMYFQAGMVEELEQYINKQVGSCVVPASGCRCSGCLLYVHLHASGSSCNSHLCKYVCLLT